MTTITIEPVNHAELEHDSSTALAIAKGMSITTPSMYELAGEELISVKSRIKALEEKRMSITAPITAAHKATMALFKPYVAVLEEAKVILEHGMLEFKALQPQESAQSEGNSIRKTWVAECTDKLALVKFVAENPAYLAVLDVNQSALNSFAKAQQEGFAVNGCKAEQRSSITSKTK